METAQNAQNTLDLSAVNRHAPPSPSKWDIIPLHTSDRETFKACRRKWDWTSPARLNLTRKVRVHGITWPLFFGTAIHYALEQYYNPILRQDPIVEFQAYIDMHWNGGLVTLDDIKRFGLEDREPSVNAQGQWSVVGLKYLLPDPDPTPYETHLDLGVGMLTFYKEYAQKNDNFSVISVEHEFSVPILKPNGEALYMVDTRVMPDDWGGDEYDVQVNIYGPLMRVGVDGQLYKQVHARGRMDKIIQDNETGQYGLHDYKTSSRQLDDDYFKHLDLDEQVTTYSYCAEREAQMYDLEYKKLDFIVYEALLKGYPSPPTVLKDGITPSIARSTETATAEMFESYIKEHGLEIIFNNDVKMQAYYTYLLEQGDSRFINRMKTYRNTAQKRNCGARLYLEACDMLQPNISIYPNARKEYSCLNCAFREPCIMAETGADYITILEDAYQGNHDR